MYVIKDGNISTGYNTLDEMCEALSDIAIAYSENGEEKLTVEIVHNPQNSNEEIRTFTQNGKTYTLTESDIRNIAAYADKLALKATAMSEVLEYLKYEYATPEEKAKVANAYGVDIDRMLSDDTLLELVEDYQTLSSVNSAESDEKELWKKTISSYIEKMLDCTLMVKDAAGGDGYAVISKQGDMYVARIINPSFDGTNDNGMAAADFYANYKIIRIDLNGLKLTGETTENAPPTVSVPVATTPVAEVEEEPEPSKESGQDTNTDDLSKLPKAVLEKAMFIHIVVDGLCRIMPLAEAEATAKRFYEQYTVAAKTHCTWMLTQEAANAIVDLATSGSGMVERLEDMSGEVFIFTLGNRVKDTLKRILM